MLMRLTRARVLTVALAACSFGVGCFERGTDQSAEKTTESEVPERTAPTVVAPEDPGPRPEFSSARAARIASLLGRVDKPTQVAIGYSVACQEPTARVRIDEWLVGEGPSVLEVSGVQCRPEAPDQQRLRRTGYLVGGPRLFVFHVEHDRRLTPVGQPSRLPELSEAHLQHLRNLGRLRSDPEAPGRVAHLLANADPLISGSTVHWMSSWLRQHSPLDIVDGWEVVVPGLLGVLRDKAQPSVVRVQALRMLRRLGALNPEDPRFRLGVESLQSAASSSDLVLADEATRSLQAIQKKARAEHLVRREGVAPDLGRGAHASNDQLEGATPGASERPDLPEHLDYKVVDQVLGSSALDFDACWDVLGAPLQRSTSVRATITPSGRLVDVTRHSEDVSLGFVACIEKILTTVEFPPTRHGRRRASIPLRISVEKAESLVDSWRVKRNALAR